MKQFIQYTYDLAGNRTRVIEPGGGRFTCAYDSLNRLSTLENPQSQRTTFSYDDNSRRTASRLSNGSRASFSYDAASNITRLANLKSDLTTLSSFDYRYDKVNNRKAMIEGDGARTTYSYDNTYQLLSEFRTGSSAYRSTYTYDNAANRTLKNESGTRTTTTYDAANQINYALASGGRTTYAYDADGNQQLALEPSGARTTTLWDYENKTKLIQLPSGVRNTMAYEPDGLRVQVQNSLGTSRFIYDGQAFLLETDGSNVTVAVFTNEPSAYTNAISQRRGSTTSWFQFDALGSTRQLSDASQNITDTYLSNAWGIPLSATGSTVNWLRYVGRYGYWFEVDTQNYNIGQRVYRPVIARWTSVDPIPLYSTSVPYAYCIINPLSLLDRSGLSTEHFVNIVARSWIDVLGIYYEGKSGDFLMSSLWPLEAAIITFSSRDNGNTSAIDDRYRLYTKRVFTFTCSKGCFEGTPTVAKVNDVGVEGPFAVAPGEIDSEYHKQSGPGTYYFGWTFLGKPNEIAEVSFQMPRNRQSVYIWHKVCGKIVCDGNDYKLTVEGDGSAFPMLSVLVNGQSAVNRPQHAFTDLWRSHPLDETRVKGRGDGGMSLNICDWPTP